MRTHKSIDHLTGSEQTYLRCIKNKIAGRFHPLLIYYFDSYYSTSIKRSCFSTKGRIEEKTFNCSILIVLPNDNMLPDNMQSHATALTMDLAQVTAFFCSLENYVQHLNDHNLFFSWIHRNAVILYEKANTSAALPEAISKPHYRKQAECFYTQNPTFTNYLNEKILILNSNIMS